MSLGDRFPQVLEAARGGEQWALTALYRELQPPLLAYLRSRCPRDAEDVAQETWIDVARALGRFVGGEPDFRRLVFVIGKRRTIDQMRRASAGPTEPLPDGSNPVSALGDAEQEAIERLSAEEAVAAVAAILSPEHAEIVLLRVLGGFSAEEVAVIMGKKPSTVRSLQHRAIRRLAVALSPEGATSPMRRAM